MNDADWFFSNKEEERKRAALRKQAEDDLRAHLEKSTKNRRRSGRRTDQMMDEGTGFRLSNFPVAQTQPKPTQEERSFSRPYGTSIEENTPPVNRSKVPRLPSISDSDQRQQRQPQSQIDDDERFFIRRLRAALEGNHINPASNMSYLPPMMPPQLPYGDPYNRPLTMTWAVPAQQPSMFTNNQQYYNNNMMNQPNQSWTNPPQGQVAVAPNMLMDLVPPSQPIRNSRNIPQSRMESPKEDYNRTSKSSTQDEGEKNFRRGVPELNRIPEWQREELEKKQQRLLANQKLLHQQMEERERQKRLQKEKEQEEELEEAQRLEREQRELDEKFRKEKQDEKNQANKKQEDKPAMSKQDAREQAKSSAAEKMLEAQREAEVLKKQKFQSKRNAAITRTREEVADKGDPVPETVPGGYDDDRPIRGQKNESSESDYKSHLKDRPRRMTARREEKGDREKSLIEELETLKLELEKEREQIRLSLLETKKFGSISETLGSSTSAAEPPLRRTINRPKVDFIIKSESSSQDKPLLTSTSTYIPVNAKFADIASPILQAPRHRSRNESPADDVVSERLAEARKLRIKSRD